MQYEIDKSQWQQCSICKKTIKDIAKEHGGANKYLSKAFLLHLQTHNIKPEEYFKHLDRPICACGICQQVVDISTIGSKIVWKKYVCGRNQGVQTWSQEAKVTRRGSNNPMYGKRPWNYAFTKENNKILQIVSSKLSNRSISDNTKKKQSHSAKKRLIHGHTGHQHTEETKAKLREHTLYMIASGRYPQTMTLPCRMLMLLLNELEIQYIVEKIVGTWSFDFYLPEYDLYIEVDGDYFHTNPKFFPNGPQTKTQKRNYYRDCKKNEFCINNHITLIRLWEWDILNNQDAIKDRIVKLCIQKK